ncbi:MAG: arsenate reductase (glutaredoxin) [Candidatus Parabeggiatoa sp. nov. 2]|nr:MAG: arsenate reductase (glutaredoxin) [Beggiatoa sp. 4572_84]RKZ52230.1 MAG: arsenate reductase (glutaredoxin) [Gammaproteobacteria bacterium]
MSQAKIYYNPRCSKSRATLKLLQEQGVEVETINYLENPPTSEELDNICQGLGIEPIALIRTKEKRFSELGLSISQPLSREKWFEIMIQNPILIERPIVVYQNKVVLGRPPENVLDILK